MTTSDKRPRRTSKTAKSTVPPPASQADNGADGARPAAGSSSAFGAGPTVGAGRADRARPKKNLAAAGALAAEAAPPADGPSIKAVKVTFASRHHEDRHASIAKAAYFRAEMRGFAPGHEVEDWLAAEEEVDQRLLGEGRAS